MTTELSLYDDKTFLVRGKMSYLFGYSSFNHLIIICFVLLLNQNSTRLLHQNSTTQTTTEAKTRCMSRLVGKHFYNVANKIAQQLGDRQKERKAVMFGNKLASFITSPSLGDVSLVTWRSQTSNFHHSSRSTSSAAGSNILTSQHDTSSCCRWSTAIAMCPSWVRPARSTHGLRRLGARDRSGEREQMRSRQVRRELRFGLAQDVLVQLIVAMCVKRSVHQLLDYLRQ